MRDDHCRKIVQKQAYDILSHRYGLFLIFGAVLLITIVSFSFGEAVVEWSNEKYAQVFNSYSDNIAGRSFRESVCSPLPIDVVYTWVNGTDPKLLNKLRALKLNLEEEFNITSDAKCVFTNCLPTNMAVLDPVLPKEMTLLTLSMTYKIFLKAEKMFTVSLDTDSSANYSVVVFQEDTNMTEVLNQQVIVHGLNTTIRRGYITTDWTVHSSVMLKDTIIMAGFPPQYTAEQIKAKFPDKISKGISKFTVDSEEGLAIIHLPKKENFDALVNIENFTLDGKKPTFSAANLVWDLRDYRRDSDISASRFEDNEELRYSLRSLERFAPWVRHVYIVTNGQIPHWMNMESSRLTIVTHQEIFPNSSHLPTFSSPAIESHIHRIPGLSQRFIYMNDDVMFGKEVWPDDFYTHSSGYKVYLTWPVPNCNEGCPSSWIKDGYCDKACNNSECEWDGGDCHGSSVQHGAGQWSGGAGWYSDKDDHCNQGCANSWLADRYCDATCNVKPCGFDVGDCGTARYEQLTGFKLERGVTHYDIPQGEIAVFFNLTSILTERGNVESAEYEKSSVIRAVAVGNKFKVITMVFNKGHNLTRLHFHLKGHYANVTEKFQYNFTVTLDTRQVNKTVENGTKTIENVNKTANVSDEVELPVVYEVPENMIHVQPKHIDHKLLPDDVNLTTVELPEFLKIQYTALLKQKEKDEVTEKGFRIEQMMLWLKYKEYLRNPSDNNTDQPHPGNRKLLGFLDIPVAMEMTRKGLTQPKGDYSEDLDNVIRFGGKYFDGSHFPWEQKNVFAEIDKLRRTKEIKKQYSGEVISPRRKLLDTFGDSLRHVNKIYNREFGFTARKVPGHMPHFVDKLIMAELHTRFPEEWDVTSSHKVRSSDDMQFAFSYAYYMMGVTRNVTAAEIFDQMDTDHSRVLSDREIRTMATRLYDLPLDLPTLSGIEDILKNCSINLPEEKQRESPPLTTTETYYDKEMPQATRSLFLNCDKMVELLQSKMKSVPKHRFVTLDDEEIAFKMIKSNVSTVVGQLDDLRKHPKKFICLNDNIEHSRHDAQTVKAILQDYYESVLPVQSQFELPREYRNRFLHIDDLREWKRLRDWLKFFTHIALVILVLFTIASFFSDRIETLQKKYRRQRPSSEENTGGILTV